MIVFTIEQQPPTRGVKHAELIRRGGRFFRIVRPGNAVALSRKLRNRVFVAFNLSFTKPVARS